MSKNFMQSTAELCFADRDLLPSYCRKPEARTSYRSNPDTNEAQRFYRAEDDLTYLYSADTRQEYEGYGDDDDDLFDEPEEGLEEHLARVWGDVDAEEFGQDSEPLHRMHASERRYSRKCLVDAPLTESDVRREIERLQLTDWNRYPYYRLRELALWNLSKSPRKIEKTKTWTETVFVPARLPQEPVDPEDRQFCQESRRAARERSLRGYMKKGDKCGRKLRKRYTRESFCRSLTEDRDSFQARRLEQLYKELRSEWPRLARRLSAA